MQPPGDHHIHAPQHPDEQDVYKRQELNQSLDAQLFCFRKGDFSEDAAKMGIPIEVIESGNPVVGLRELKRRLAGQKVDIIHCLSLIHIWSCEIWDME